MVIDIPRLKYSLDPAAMSLGKKMISSLNFSELLDRFKLLESELVNIADLPAPIVAYKEALETGTSKSVLDLGSTGFTLVGRIV